MKRKRGKKQGKSVLISWAISYLLVLLVPFTAIFINHYYSIQSIEAEVYNANELALNNWGVSLDDRMREISAFYSYIYFEESLQDVRTSSEKDSLFRYEVQKVVGQLNTYISYRTQMSAILYFPDLEYVIDTEKGIDEQSYYASYQRAVSDAPQYEAWKKLLEGNYKDSFFTGRYFHMDTGEECIVYANSIRKKGYQPVNVFVSIPVSKFSELTAELGEDTRILIMVDNCVDAVFSNNGIEPVTEEIQKVAFLSKEELSGTDYYLLERDSETRKDVSYRLLISREKFLEQRQFIRNVFFVSTSITLLVGLVVVSALLRRNFRPISRLVSRMNDKEEWKGNEYGLIEHVYENLQNENATMHNHLSTIGEKMQSNYLLAVMKGRKIEEFENAIHIPKDQKIIMVCIMVPFNDEQQLRHDELMMFAADNIFSELMEKSEFYKAEEGQHLFYLFVVKEQEEMWRKNCLVHANYLSQIMKKHWKQEVFIVVSDTKDELEEIRFQYRDVLDVIKDKNLLSGTTVIDISRNYNMLSTNQKLVQKIKNLVEERYADCNLNVTELAEELERTPKYIAEIFKVETGNSLLYYINHMRIMKARAMMRTGQYKLKEVCEMVGYSNMNTFRRNFQQIVGISPGKYMEKETEEGWESM